MKAVGARERPEFRDGEPSGRSAAGPERNGQLLQGYLHKTSNSLCGIKGYASLIAAEKAHDRQLAGWAGKILAEVETMQRVYRSIQDVAFPSWQEPSGRGLPSAVAAAVSQARRSHRNLSVQVELGYCGRSLLPARDLQLILTELLHNSAEGAAGDGRARQPVEAAVFTTTDSPGQVDLVVTDDGPGIEPALAPQVTAPFITTKEGHLGIGLARVETIMDMYGLNWSLRSEPGRGTTVTLTVADRPLPPKGPAGKEE